MSDGVELAGDGGRPDPQRLIASFPLAVLLLAPDMTVAGVNPAAEQLLGQGARRLLGRQLTGVLDFTEAHIAQRIGEGDAQLFARDCGVRIGRQARRLDLTLAPVVGHHRWQMLTLHEPIGVEALGDAQSQGGAPLRAPDILAHEIKNPLAGIRGAAQLLARSANGTQKPLTELIAAEVDRITQLIDRMQTLGRRGSEPQRPFNVHEALRRAVAVLNAGTSAGITIHEEFDPSLPAVMCNPDSLVQVVINLLANAREAASEAPAPALMIRTRFASGIRLHGLEGRAPLPLPIEIRISDNGAGIDAKLGDHIFEPFVSTKQNGQGLGLALVRKLVREMNGRITFDRDEAAGLTHFRVHLPVAGRAAAEASAAA